MSAPARLQPVQRRRIALGALGLLAVFAGIVGIGELLRHPVTVEGGADLPSSDPRDEIVCAEPQPREGQERDEPEAGRRPVRVTSSDLYDCPQVYDGRMVRYRGEVIGALLQRTDGVWTQLNDDAYADVLGPLPGHRGFQGANSGVGVLLSPELAGTVEHVGGPNTRGDILDVEGIFHRVDPSGEVAVVHAAAGSVELVGQPADEPLLIDRVVAAVLATVVMLCVVFAERMIAARR